MLLLSSPPTFYSSLILFAVGMQTAHQIPKASSVPSSIPVSEPHSHSPSLVRLPLTYLAQSRAHTLLDIA